MADGLNLMPVEVEEFQIGTVETYDIVVEPTGEAHTIVAENMERSGIDCLDHGAMDNGPMQPQGGGPSEVSQPKSKSPMDRSRMDHSAMGHDATTLETSSRLPPALAGSAPPRAADAIWSVNTMRECREQLRDDQGGQKYSWF